MGALFRVISNIHTHSYILSIKIKNLWCSMATSRIEEDYIKYWWQGQGISYHAWCNLNSALNETRSAGNKWPSHIKVQIKYSCSWVNWWRAHLFVSNFISRRRHHDSQEQRNLGQTRVLVFTICIHLWNMFNKLSSCVLNMHKQINIYTYIYIYAYMYIYPLKVFIQVIFSRVRIF